jgi:hypothetical protein
MKSKLPPRGEEEVNMAMVKLMIDLEGCDKPDKEWLSLREKRKALAKKQA